MNAQAQLPQYQSHKKVWALKITGINTEAGELIFEGSGFSPIQVSPEWMNKHQPQSGGYYVVYDDGYKSYSPAEAFESGYVPAAGSSVMRSTYRNLDDTEKKRIDDIKSVAATLFALIDSAGPSREGSLAKTNLEQSVMWAVKGITG